MPQIDVWATDVLEADAAAIERAVRTRFNRPFHEPLWIGAPGKIDLAGSTRDARAFFTGRGATRTAWCAAIVPAGGTSTLVTYFVIANLAHEGRAARTPTVWQPDRAQPTSELQLALGDPNPSPHREHAI